MGQTTAPPTSAETQGWQAKKGHHYTVAELSEEWNVSTEFIRDLFRHEPDVVCWVRRRPGRRRYVTMRIPSSAAERAYRRAQRT
jgi:hypothetical protein